MSERDAATIRERPTTAPSDGKPYPGHMIRCPECRQHRFDWMGWDYGACERRACGYVWHSRGSTDHPSAVGSRSSVGSAPGSATTGVREAP